MAGLFLVILYVVSDFGAVSLLRFQTFTYAIYQQMTGRYDYGAASILSLLLVLFAFIFLIAERWFRQQSRFYQTGGHIRTAHPATPQTLRSGSNASDHCIYFHGLWSCLWPSRLVAHEMVMDGLG